MPPIAKGGKAAGKDKGKVGKRTPLPSEDAVPPPLPMPGADFGIVTREVVKPSNQLQLSAVDLEEEIAKMLTANNPQAPSNIARFNMRERLYKFDPMVEQTIVHYATDGWLVHKTSDDAKKQLVEEKVQAEMMAKFQAEMEKANEHKDAGNDAEGPDDSRQLRNQFNFSERAGQTINFPMRDAGTFTEPPPTATASGSCTFTEIYDEYLKDVLRQRLEESNRGRKKVDEKKEEKNKPPPKEDVEPMESPELETTLTIIDRMVNQNKFKEIITDYKFWDDPADAIRTREGSLLPLWGFNKEVKKKKNVTAICWSPLYMDMFAVGYGSYNFQKQAAGVIEVFSLKNPLHPEFTLATDSGVMSLHLHPEFPNLLAVGCYDGTVAVFDIRSGKNEPMYLATAKSGKHNDPVWSVYWQVDELLKSLQFCSISTDGQVILWTLSKAELQLEVIMQLRAPGATPGPDGPVAMVSGGCAMDFCKAPGQDHMYLVGTEEGNVHRCSKAYNGSLHMYCGHSMTVYAVRWNHIHHRMFLSASADWSVRLWDSRRTDKPVMKFDLGDSVGDVAWAPFSASIFAAVTDDGKVHIFDVAENRLAPLCVQKVSKRKLTKVAFNPREPILLVGDSEGVVHCLKLSPNLRKMSKPGPGQKFDEMEVAKLDHVCDVAWKSQAADKN